MEFQLEDMKRAFEEIKPYMGMNGYFTAMIDPQRVNVTIAAVKHFTGRTIHILEEEYTDGGVIVGTR